MSLTKLLLLFLFALVLILPGCLYAQTEEYALKAVFLEKFTPYVEWPRDTVVHDESADFIIIIFGRNPFGTILDEIYAEQKIMNKNVEIRYVSRISEIDNCDMLFISGSMKDELPVILKRTSGKPILVVGDTEGFAEAGVFVNLFVANNNIRFEINETAITNAGFKVNFRLLRLARIVNPKGGAR